MSANKMNKSRALYFERNERYNELYFTSNDLAYVSENAAKGEAGKLVKAANGDVKKGEVDKLTRGDYNAWKANDGSGVKDSGQGQPAANPERAAKEAKLQELRVNLGVANKAIADADKALGKLTDKSKPETRTKYETAKADVEKTAAALQAEIDTVTAELEALG